MADKGLHLDTSHLEGFVSDEELSRIFPEVEKAHSFITNGNGPGGEFLGWLDIPNYTTENEMEEIESCADDLRKRSDVIIVVGIGGSYLGARAAIGMAASEKEKGRVIFAGNNLSGDRLEEILGMIESKDISVNVISKSGTTTEPALAFRIIESGMKKKYGARDIRDRIVCTTDKEKGALRAMADKRGYKTFVIPRAAGGRFSVLTPVGLLPAACAGINIREIMKGAKFCMKNTELCDLKRNPAYMYAAIRNILQRKDKSIEILSSFDPKIHFLAEWWKQLFGESEGKEGQGIFPAACDLTQDLHSMGQFIQQGARNIFETFLFVEKDDSDCSIPGDEDDLDNLNYLTGKQVSFVNTQAYLATREAHLEGGVPNSTISVKERSAFCLGELFYFFEKAVAASAYISGVNPFDQPGVESYKQKMFKLLGKPGV